MHDGNVIISLRSLSYAYTGYKKQQILDCADLHICQGELIALVAPSGSGKSTLLHIIGLLDKADKGQYFINGQEAPLPTSNYAAKLRNQQFGFVFQFHHLISECHVLDNIAMPLLIQGKSKKNARKQAMQSLEMLNLQHYAMRHINQLSGGEQQRIAILRALIHYPMLILADEPTGNLDPDNAELVFDLFVTYAKHQQSAVLIATHNYDLAKKCDRIITITHKKIEIFDDKR